MIKGEEKIHQNVE